MQCIWAVAKNTLKQALRMKIAIVSIILLLVLLPVLGFTTTGDGTLKGRLQTFLSYGLSLTSFLLCILTISISIYSVTNDIKERQIFTVITKPIRRFQFLLGKLLGVVLFDIVLLSIFSIIIFANALYMPKFYDVTEEELIQAENEFYTAREGVVMPEADVKEDVQRMYERLKESGELIEDLSHGEIIAELTSQMQVASRAVDIGWGKTWEFENVKPLAESIFIRFKYEVLQEPPDSQIYSRWLVGDPHTIKTGEMVKTPIYDGFHRNSVDTFYEIEISKEVVPEHGRLAVAFQNYPSNNTVIIFPRNGLEVLFKADSFSGNFFRAVLLILSRLIFLACLGILASSFLSFPVAILLCFVVFFAASFSGFFLESFGFLSKTAGIFYNYSIKWMIQLLPQFDKFNPTKFLVSARLISWSFLASCFLFMVCIKAFLLLILSFIIFGYREIAKIII